MVLILFTMAFVIGPTLFFVLVQYDGRRWPLLLIAAVLVVLSIAFHNEARLAVDPNALPVFVSILLLWLSWVMVLVALTRAVRKRFPSLKARRLSRAVGAMGTTIPWFGFAASQILVN